MVNLLHSDLRMRHCIHQFVYWRDVYTCHTRVPLYNVMVEQAGGRHIGSRGDLVSGGEGTDNQNIHIICMNCAGQH